MIMQLIAYRTLGGSFTYFKMITLGTTVLSLLKNSRDIWKYFKLKNNIYEYTKIGALDRRASVSNRE